jgi:hypothetical protein
LALFTCTAGIQNKMNYSPFFLAVFRDTTSMLMTSFLTSTLGHPNITLFNIILLYIYSLYFDGKKVQTKSEKVKVKTEN